MPKTPSEDDVLRRMLKTPPQPFTPKPKKKPSRGKGKAKKKATGFQNMAIDLTPEEIAALRAHRKRQHEYFQKVFAKDREEALGRSPSFLAPKLAAERRDLVAAGLAPADEIKRQLSDRSGLRESADT